MKLNYLRDFIAVAKAGSVRAAARELGLSQPTLTKSIHHLEQELGRPLFDRTVKGATLNAFGKSYRVRAEHVSNELRRAEDELRQMDSPTGHVAIAVSGTPAMQFLPGALRSFKRRYPEATVRIIEGVYAAMLPELRANALDFALMPEPTMPLGSEFVVEPVFRDRRVVICRKGHPLRSSKSLADLLGAQWIVTAAADPRSVEFDAPFTTNGLTVPRADIQCESLIALLSLVANSDLLVMLPRQWLTTKITEHLLEEIPVRERIEAPTICLIRRDSLPLTPAAEAFANALIFEARQHMTIPDGPMPHSLLSRPRRRARAAAP